MRCVTPSLIARYTTGHSLGLKAFYRLQLPALWSAISLNAAATNSEVPIRVVLAWQPSEGASRLVGAWAFALERPRKSPLPSQVTASPAEVHSCEYDRPQKAMACC